MCQVFGRPRIGLFRSGYMLPGRRSWIKRGSRGLKVVDFTIKILEVRNEYGLFIFGWVMPVDWSLYPDDWREIALAVKEEADWQCEMCGKQCRRPGEMFDTHKRTLTVAHCNHDSMDCRPENLCAACAPCHLRYDAQHHAETRRQKTTVKNDRLSPYHKEGRKLMTTFIIKE